VRIAFIRTDFDPFGGAELFTQRLVESLIKKGVEVHFFARTWKGEQNSAIHMHQIGGPGSPSVLRQFWFVNAVKREVEKYSFDLVQSNERTLCQQVYRAGDGVHARWLELRCARFGFWRRLSIKINPFHCYLLWLEKRMFEDAALKAVIVNSNMVRKEITSRFEIEDEKIHTIYNGIDIEKFHPRLRKTEGAQLRQQNGVRDDELVILFVGSGYERKGLLPLLKAFAMSGVCGKLWVVGKGDVKKYQREARCLGIEDIVTFWGPQKNTPSFYAAADIFVLPTLYDPFPSVILEAMASEVPVITTVNSGAAEIIEQGKEGFVMSAPEAIEELVSYIEQLSNYKLRGEMAKHARMKVENFSMKKKSEETMQLYRTLISQNI